MSNYTTKKYNYTQTREINKREVTRTLREWRQNKYEKYQKYLDEIYEQNICVKYLEYQNVDDFGGLNCPCRRRNTDPVTISGNSWRIKKGRVIEHTGCETHCNFLASKISKQEYNDHIAALLIHYNKSTYDELKEYLKDKDKPTKQNKSCNDKSDNVEQNLNDCINKKHGDNDVDMSQKFASDDTADTQQEKLLSIGKKTILLLCDALRHINSSSTVAANFEQPVLDKGIINDDHNTRQKRLNNFLFVSDTSLRDPNVELYRSSMASLRLMYQMVISNVPIYKFADWSSTVADFGGYDISDHLSQTSATDFLLTLGEAQRQIDNQQIKNAKTIFITIDAQSKNHDSWTGILSSIRDENGIKKTIFTHGEYKVKKSSIESANEKQLMESGKPRMKRNKKKPPKASRFQFANYINSTGDDITVVSNNGNNANNENKNDDKEALKPSQKLQLWFEDVFNNIGIDWKKVNGLGTDGGTTEKSGMQGVCLSIITNCK